MYSGAKNLQKNNSITNETEVCVYCGKNPTPHFLAWYFESMNLWLTPVRKVLLFNPLSTVIKKIFIKINLSLRFFRLGRFLGIIGLQEDINKCKVLRAKVLWEEAQKRGIEMKELLLFGKPFDTYIATKKEFLKKQQMSNSKPTIIFSGLPRPQDYNDSSLDWMDDKWLFKKKLLQHNLPVANGAAAWTFNRAKKFFYEIQATRYPLPATRLPVIIKPRAGSRGRHSTIFVSSVDDLRHAFKIAKQLCFWVVVEEQLSGPVYRATLINYELCGVLRGDGPQVVGDGVRNIRELIEIKNSQPHLGVKDIQVDASMELFLSRQNLNLRAVPKKDEVINLSEKIGVNYGGSSSEDFEVCHADNKELFIRAAKIIGDPIVGFDFIIPDITKSWKEQRSGFIEANSLPFINLHHDPLHGQPRNLASKVWEMKNW